MSHDAVIAPIQEWLIDESLGRSDVVALFETLCNRVAGAGIPVSRARLIWPTLHPLFQAETVVWNEGEETFLDQFEHQDQASDAWNRSPLKFAVDRQLEVLRRRLDGPNELLDFELMRDLKEEGYTDFVLYSTAIEGTFSRRRDDGEGQRGILATWATKKPGGFSNDDLTAMHRIQRRFAVACKTVIQARISTNIATTYLGNRAGGNVLNGQIRRGDGSRTNAVVWYSDLRNSTSLAESMEPADYFDLLNTYFSATAEPVVENGGEILDFIGDAVLGIFPYSEESEFRDAAHQASLALDQALILGREYNAEREARGVERYGFGIGINSGEVMFGNIGIPSRLAFSVIGPTVNQVARIEGMTKELQQQVLADASIASLDNTRWKSVGEHKLAGVLEPVELFAFQCSVTRAQAAAG